MPEQQRNVDMQQNLAGVIISEMHLSLWQVLLKQLNPH